MRVCVRGGVCVCVRCEGGSVSEGVCVMQSYPLWQFSSP